MTAAVPTASGGPPAPKPRPSGWLLAFASSLSPFGMSIVLPTLAVVGNEFDVSPAAAQFLISAYLFGLGLMQPFSGYLCDRFGRRPVLLCGSLLFGAASVGCALASSFPALIAGRFLQAVGISVGTVSARAIIRDTHDPLAAVAAIARLAAAMGVAPIIAPTIGGIVAASTGTKGVFVLTAVLAGIVLVWVYRSLAETGTPQPDQPIRDALRGYSELLQTPTFVAFTLAYGFLQGAFFTFLGVGATIFADYLGLGAAAFGAMWGVLGIVYVLAAANSAAASRRLGQTRTLGLGLALACLGGVVMMVTGLVQVTLIGIMLPLTLLMVASGLVAPIALAGAVAGQPEVAGRAAGLSSAVGLALSGAFAIASGAIYRDSFWRVAALMLFAVLLAAATYPVLRRAQRAAASAD